ncbi:MAG: hypothetical protein OXF88_12345 [Rhodobacteraceae bacterium]|nr:hypothetical protein [Paracoccaceae bacterium]
MDETVAEAHEALKVGLHSASWIGCHLVEPLQSRPLMHYQFTQGVP